MPKSKKPMVLRLSQEVKEDLFKQAILYFSKHKGMSDVTALESAYLLTYRTIYGWEGCRHKTKQSRLGYRLRGRSYGIFMEYADLSKWGHILERFPVFTQYDIEHGRRIRGKSLKKGQIHRKSLTGQESSDKKVVGKDMGDYVIDLGDLNSLDRDELVIYLDKEDEKKLWLKWKDDFFRDYEINSSTDTALMYEYLKERLFQHRLFVRNLTHPEEIIDKELNDSQKRLNDAIFALGATRRQRISSGEIGQEANLSELAVSVDNKLKSGVILEEEKKQTINEQEMLKIKEERGPSNFVSDAELASVSIESVLGEGSYVKSD